MPVLVPTLPFPSSPPTKYPITPKPRLSPKPTPITISNGRLIDAFCVVVHASVWDAPEDRATLVALSLTCKTIRHAALPVLFSAVRWPLKNRVVVNQGPEFIPESIWPHIRSFSLEWPDEWSHRDNPNWGKFHHRFDADYDPSFNLIHYLMQSLTKMSSIQTFRLDCPFFLPDRLYEAIFSLSDLRALILRDTPLYLPKASHRCEKLERISLCPVSEALCVGNEARDPDLEDPRYYEYPHRSKCNLNVAFGRTATKTLLWQVAFSDKLSTLEISTSLCNFHDLQYSTASRTMLSWPRLRTFIITGPVPPEPLNEGDRGNGHLLDVVERMPSLRDLRVLLGQKDGHSKGIPKMPLTHSSSSTKPFVLSRLRRLAVSLAVDLDGLFGYTTNLEELAVLTIAQHPKEPVAISCEEARRLIDDLAAAKMENNSPLSLALEHVPLKRLRMIVEDEPSASFCDHIASRCPYLEDLELEWRGYQDGVRLPRWNEYGAALSPLAFSLRSLRLGVGFPPSKCHHHRENSITTPASTSPTTKTSSSLPSSIHSFTTCCSREQCGVYLARCLPALEKIGFEYSDKVKRSDRWDEWNIHRSASFSTSSSSTTSPSFPSSPSPPADDISGSVVIHDTEEGWQQLSLASPVGNSKSAQLCGGIDTIGRASSFVVDHHMSGEKDITLEMRRPVEYRFPEVWEAVEVKVK